MGMTTKITKKRPIKATNINSTDNYSLFFVKRLQIFLAVDTFTLGYFACADAGTRRCLQISHPCLNCHLLKEVVKVLDVSLAAASLFPQLKLLNTAEHTAPRQKYCHLLLHFHAFPKLWKEKLRGPENGLLQWTRLVQSFVSYTWKLNGKTYNGSLEHVINSEILQKKKTPQYKYHCIHWQKIHSEVSHTTLVSIACYNRWRCSAGNMEEDFCCTLFVCLCCECLSVSVWKIYYCMDSSRVCIVSYIDALRKGENWNCFS